jgi:hypothetical protein
LLVDAHRIVGAEDRDRRAETDALGDPGDGGQDYCRRRRSEVWSMVLTDAVDVEAHLFGELCLFDHPTKALTVRYGFPGVRVGIGLGEGRDTQFHRARLSASDHLPAQISASSSASRREKLWLMAAAAPVLR